MIENMTQFQYCRVPEPSQYFRIETPRFSEVIASNPRVVSLLARIKTGAEWERLGINPYNIRTFETDPEDWSSERFGVDEIDGIQCCFTRIFPELDRGSSQAIRDGSRFVTGYHEALDLRRFGIAWEEMPRTARHIIDAVEACCALERNCLDEAIQRARAAIAGNPKEHRYREILERARLLNGEVQAVLDALDYYANDMNTVADHSQKYLKVLIAADRYDVVLDVILKVIAAVNVLISRKRDNKKSIYGAQAKIFYVNSRKNFLARIATMRGVLCERLIQTNHGRREDLLKILDLVESAHPEKAKKLLKLRALLS